MLLKSFRPTAVLFSSDNSGAEIKKLSGGREIIVGRIDFSINNNS